jgi:hypothetical protein
LHLATTIATEAEERPERGTLEAPISTLLIVKINNKGPEMLLFKAIQYMAVSPL